MANDLINCAYALRPPQKPLNDRIQGASGLVRTSRHWEGEAAGEGFPHASSPLGCAWDVFFIMNEFQEKLQKKCP